MRVLEGRSAYSSAPRNQHKGYIYPFRLEISYDCRMASRCYIASVVIGMLISLYLFSFQQPIYLEDPLTLYPVSFYFS